jgi:hypothetical protein
VEINELKEKFQKEQETAKKLQEQLEHSSSEYSTKVHKLEFQLKESSLEVFWMTRKILMRKG